MYQSGLRTNHSTELCLAQLTDFVATGMDKQIPSSMILVDPQKAFDTLEHAVRLLCYLCVLTNLQGSY